MEWPQDKLFNWWCPFFGDPYRTKAWLHSTSHSISHRWNPGGTLVEPWWNLGGTLPQGRPEPPRSLSGLRPQSFQLLGKKIKMGGAPTPRWFHWFWPTAKSKRESANATQKPRRPCPALHRQRPWKRSGRAKDVRKNCPGCQCLPKKSTTPFHPPAKGQPKLWGRVFPPTPVSSGLWKVWAWLELVPIVGLHGISWAVFFVSLLSWGGLVTLFGVEGTQR